MRPLSKAALYLSLTFAAALVCDAEIPLPPVTIIVFNRDVPESVALAKFYAQKRGIARDHLVGLSCSPNEEINRDEYEATIAEPLRFVFKERNWWTVHDSTDGRSSVTANSIRFVALMKGVPMKIRRPLIIVVISQRRARLGVATKPPSIQSWPVLVFSPNKFPARNRTRTSRVTAAFPNSKLRHSCSFAVSTRPRRRRCDA